MFGFPMVGMCGWNVDKTIADGRCGKTMMRENEDAGRMEDVKRGNIGDERFAARRRILQE